MAKNHHHTLVNDLQHSRISPPQGSIPPTTLPLTFFDIPWLLFTPNQPLFFYDLPQYTTATHFSQTILPNLKQSLSLTLHHFFPLAGTLVLPPQPPSKPHLIFKESDGLLFEFHESNEDYQFLAGYHPRNIDELQHLVPRFRIQSSTTLEAKYIPLLSVKITFFPFLGFCIGFALRQVAADGRTFDNFLKSWAAIYKTLHQKSPNLSFLEKFAQCHDRGVIHDPNNLEPVFLKQWWQLNNNEGTENGTLSDDDNKVLATFLVCPPHMHKLKGWILTRSMEIFGSTHTHLLLLSPYVLTCAFIWVCWMKTNFEDQVHEFPEMPHYLGFIAGGIHRLKYLVPKNYFGNCIGFGKAMVKREQLIGKDGIIYAAKALGDAIKELDRDVLGKGKNWISDWNLMLGSEYHLTINGSPKVSTYELDFGWGIPKKVEEMSIKKTNGISLCESREVKGGIEVGLALPKTKMDVFGSLFNEGLKII